VEGAEGEIEETEGASDLLLEEEGHPVEAGHHQGDDLPLAEVDHLGVHLGVADLHLGEGFVDGPHHEEGVLHPAEIDDRDREIGDAGVVASRGAGLCHHLVMSPLYLGVDLLRNQAQTPQGQGHVRKHWNQVNARARVSAQKICSAIFLSIFVLLPSLKVGKDTYVSLKRMF